MQSTEVRLGLGLVRIRVSDPRWIASSAQTIEHAETSELSLYIYTMSSLAETWRKKYFRRRYFHLSILNIIALLLFYVIHYFLFCIYFSVYCTLSHPHHKGLSIFFLVAGNFLICS